MAESTSSGEVRNLWTDVKRMNCKTRSIPATMDGYCGEEAVAEVLAHKYKDPYNSVSYTQDDMDSLMAVASKVDEHCCTGLCSKDHDAKPD